MTPKQLRGRTGHSEHGRSRGSRRRESFEWAAQQETSILAVDNVEAGPDSVEINPQVYVALAELLELCRALHEAQVWNLGGDS